MIRCTGFSEIVTEETARKMDVRAYMMKPLGMRELAGTVRGVLDRREAE